MTGIDEMEDADDGDGQLCDRRWQLLSTISELTEQLRQAEAERDTTREEVARLNRVHEDVLSKSVRLQAQLARATQDRNDSRYAKVIGLVEARARFAAEQDRQRSEMGDERRVAEDRLQSIIHDNLDTISRQIEEIQDMRRQLGEAEARSANPGSDE